MILVDKGYYDYDFEKVEYKKQTVWEETIKSEEELKNILVGFGFTHLAKKPQTAEELQSYIIKQMEDK